MKHNVNELFKIYNVSRPFIATEEYIKKYNIPISSRGGSAPYAIRMSYRVNNGRPVALYTKDSVVQIYFFGEKTWFDTEEELKAHRAQRQKDKEKASRYNKAIGRIQYTLDRMTIEELEELADELEGR